MKTATVIGAGPAEHPESGKDLMKVTVAAAYAIDGETCLSTDVWCERDMPEPKFGEVLSWGSSHVWLRGARYDKIEYDSPTNAPLH